MVPSLQIIDTVNHRRKQIRDPGYQFIQYLLYVCWKPADNAKNVNNHLTPARNKRYIKPNQGPGLDLKIVLSGNESWAGTRIISMKVLSRQGKC